MKILLAVDGSAYTKRMLAYLAAHDELLGAHQVYTAVHVTPALPSRAASLLNKADVKAYYEEESEKVLKPIRTFFSKRGLSLQTVSKVGHAHEVLSKAAEAGGYDLLVMGSHGHGTLGRLVLGSVSSKVLASTTVPVLIIR